MGIGSGIFLFAIGAIMRFAISAQVQGFSIHMIGVVLMFAGAAVVVLSMFFLQSWGGFHRGARETTVVQEREVL